MSGSTVNAYPPQKPSILLVTPVFPDVTGYGLAMRAGALLEALAAYGQVYVLIIPFYDPGKTAMPERMRPFYAGCSVIPVFRMERGMARLKDAVQAIRRKPVMLPGSSFATTRIRRAVDRAYGQARFDYVYVFRLYMTPYVSSFLSRSSLKGRFLDIDDIESRTRSGIAALYRANGRPGPARREARAARLAAAWEHELLPRFDGISVCSRADQERMSRYLPAPKIHVLPNIVRRPDCIPPPGDADTFNLLFVGNLNYYPNRDALVFFIEEILPLLRSRAERPVRFTVAGSGKWSGLQKYRHHADCHFAGFVPDVAPYYARANAVVVPLRAGGGTRIKILEAFSFRRPVITTAIGAEGLEVAHETHVLIADQAGRFAGQCCRVLEDRQLADTLTVNAMACLNAHYTLDALRQSLGRMFA